MEGEVKVEVEVEVEVEAKLELNLAGSSSSNTKPILVKFLVLHLMAIPNKLMIPGGCQG